MRSPQTSHEAAQHVDRWRAKHNRTNRVWRKRDEVAAQMEHLYRSERSVAYQRHQDARSADLREEAVYGHGLDETTTQRVSECVAAVGVEYSPLTVGDLRYLRDLTKAMAERAKQAVRDSADELDAWRGVLSMAKAEADLARNSPGGGES